MSGQPRISAVTRGTASDHGPMDGSHRGGRGKEQSTRSAQVGLGSPGISGPLTPVKSGLSRSLADSLPRRSGRIAARTAQIPKLTAQTSQPSYGSYPNDGILTVPLRARSWQIRGQIAAGEGDRSCVRVGRYHSGHGPECWTHNPSVIGSEPGAGMNDLRSGALRESPAHCRAESAICMVLGRCAPILVVTIRDDLGSGSGNWGGLQAQQELDLGVCAAQFVGGPSGQGVMNGRIQLSLSVADRMVER